MIKAKFRKKQTEQNLNLFWGRYAEDHLPFRGQEAPLYKQEEWEEKVVVVHDVRNGFFDVTNPVENQLFRDVLECCLSKWFQLLHLERFWVDGQGKRTTKHYMEWVEFYLEDGTTRTPFEKIKDEQSHMLNNIITS
jgi:hypothetical protein